MILFLRKLFLYVVIHNLHYNTSIYIWYTTFSTSDNLYNYEENDEAISQFFIFYNYVYI